jgi:hypothetical protein
VTPVMSRTVVPIQVGRVERRRLSRPPGNALLSRAGRRRRHAWPPGGAWESVSVGQPMPEGTDVVLGFDGAYVVGQSPSRRGRGVRGHHRADHDRPAPVHSTP